jgi:hypothetical protein
MQQHQHHRMGGIMVIYIDHCRSIEIDATTTTPVNWGNYCSIRTTICGTRYYNCRIGNCKVDKNKGVVYSTN